MRRALFSVWTAVMIGLAYVGFLKIAGEPVPQRAMMISAAVLALVMAPFHYYVSRRGQRR
jgi:hypothetical protein